MPDGRRVKIKEMQITIKTLKKLKTLAELIEKNAVPERNVIALSGELGTGKTAFSKFFLKAAGVKNKITSPTFVLLNRYQAGQSSYFHIDLYRLRSYKEVQALGIPELWNHKNNVFLIEWADKIRGKLPKKTMHLKFKVAAAGKTGAARKIQILNAPQKMVKMIGQHYN